MQNDIDDFLSSVDETMRLATLDKSQILQHLFEGGKKVRPRFTYYAAKICLGDNGFNGDLYKSVVMAGAAVECTHIGSLYHDDIMDNSPKRHNKITLHYKYDNNIGIIAGDILFATCCELAAQLPQEATLMLAKAFKAICYAQMNEDLDKPEQLINRASHSQLSANIQANEDYLNELSKVVYEKENNPEFNIKALRHYFRIISGKTASLIAACAGIGAICATADTKQIKSLTDIGFRIGMAFQIIDDILDLKCENLDKATGLDAQNKVYTLPSILGEKKAYAIAESYTNCALKTLGNIANNDNQKSIKEFSDFIAKLLKRNR